MSVASADAVTLKSINTLRNAYLQNFQASKNFPPTTTSLCDNSNDSGLGFDESHHHHPTLALINSNTNGGGNYHRPLSSTLR